MYLFSQSSAGVAGARGQGQHRPGPSDDILDSEYESSSAPKELDMDDSAEWETDSGEDYGEAETFASNAGSVRREKKAPLQDDERQKVLLHYLSHLKGDMKDVVLLAAKNIVKRSERTSKWLTANHALPETLGQAMLSSIKPPENWSEANENAARAEWEASLERASISGWSPESNSEMIPLWQCMIRLCGVLPSEFLSATWRLQYGDTTLPDGTPSPNWDSTFCRRLRVVCCHGVFMGNLEVLQFALVWASLCRQDYRGSLKWSQFGHDTLVNRLLESLAARDPTMTIPEIREAVLEGDSFERPHSFLFALLQGIEERCFSPKVSGLTEEPGCFSVTSEDIRRVTLAANAIRSNGYPAFVSAAESSQVLFNSLGSQGYPSTATELASLRNESGFNAVRWRICRAGQVEAVEPMEDVVMEKELGRRDASGSRPSQQSATRSASKNEPGNSSPSKQSWLQENPTFSSPHRRLQKKHVMAEPSEQPAELVYTPRCSVNSAWLQSEREISQFVESLPGSAVSVAYLQSQRASGKSTTLPAYIAAMFQQNPELEDCRIIYMVSTEAECTILKDFVLGNTFVPVKATSNPPFSKTPRPAAVSIISYEVFIKTPECFLRPPGTQESGLLILMDLEIRPTTPGEISMGLVTDWATSQGSGPVQGNGVLVMATQPSDPTMELLRSICDHVQYMEVPHIDFNLQERRDLARDPIQEINGMMEASTRESRVMVGSSEPWVYDLGEGIPHTATGPGQADDLARDLQKGLPLVIDPNLSFSLADPGLSTIISSGLVTVETFMGDLAQVVRHERPMTLAELQLEMSWGLKSAHADVSYYQVNPDGGADPGEDSVGNAYGRSFLWTVLETIEKWPGLHPVAAPVRKLADMSLILEACRRLALNGSIVKDPGALTWQLSDLARMALKVQRENPHMAFTRAHFLARILNNCCTRSSNMQRVAIRLFCIMEVGGVCHKQGPVSSDDLDRVCSGVGHSQRGLGGLWVQLGVWQAEKLTLNQGRPKWLVVDFQRMHQVSQKIAAIEAVCQMPPSDLLEDVALTAEEVARLEDDLMRTFVDQMAEFGSQGAGLRDAASQTKLSRSSEDFLNPSEVRARPGYEAGFMAIYTSLDRVRGRYKAANLKLVPIPAIKNLVSHTNKPLGETLGTLYALDI